MNITIADRMVVTISHALKGAKNCFHGVASPVPMVSILLAKAMNNDGMVYLNITGGVDVAPKTLDISTDSAQLFAGTKSVFGLTDIFDLAARGQLDVAFLSGVQIDKHAHLNNSVIGKYEHPKVRLPGGAGSAVLVPNAKRAFIWRTRHDKKTFVEQVDFITSLGNVYQVFTPLGVFVKKDGVLKLQAIYSNVTLSEVVELTGFEFDSTGYQTLPDPTPEEIAMLAKIDPGRIRESEF